MLRRPGFTHLRPDFIGPGRLFDIITYGGFVETRGRHVFLPWDSVCQMIMGVNHDERRNAAGNNSSISSSLTTGRCCCDAINSRGADHAVMHWIQLLGSAPAPTSPARTPLGLTARTGFSEKLSSVLSSSIRYSCRADKELKNSMMLEQLVHGQVTIIFVVSVGLSVCLFVCLCRVFLSSLWSDFDQTWTYVICLGLVVSPRI